MGDNAILTGDYLSLKDFRVEIEKPEEVFSLCFWLYILKPITFPAAIIEQVHKDITNNAPFLAFNEKKKMMLLPLSVSHKETPYTSGPTSLTKVPHASMETEFALEKWVHVGCEVSVNFVRLHIDGEIVGEQPLSSLFNKGLKLDNLQKIVLAGSSGEDGLLGYMHGLGVLPSTLSIKDQCRKDPPPQLWIDNSSASDFEVGIDGVWSIVGGKIHGHQKRLCSLYLTATEYIASCRRIFSLDVLLLNAFGQPINKELEVVASLLYADNGEPVEKTSDADAPLLTNYDGIEFSSFDRPSKLLHGRASFKLKIAQLSSKCENRLFRIKFQMEKVGRFPFLEAFSNPIRCISRSRNARQYLPIWKSPTSAVHPLSGSQSFFSHNKSVELQKRILREAKRRPSSERHKLGHANASPVEQLDEECNSLPWTASKVGDDFCANGDWRSVVDTSPSDSESVEGKVSASKTMSANEKPASDLNVFKYCLGGLSERTFLLKEVATSASEKELLEFANQVSLYSGCSHHRHQITVARRLMEEGTKVWNSIAKNNHLVRWESAIYEIEEKFIRIAHCTTRSLIRQDFELLRKLAECEEYMAWENFEKMWCWLYPVALTLSRDWINPLWNSSPKWIEGFITTEEAEISLQGPRGLQEPGTFVLRFPASRSWPHPDAGSLIVTYVGSDNMLHHRLLSLDYFNSSAGRAGNAKPLKEMLLAEPELTRLGRIIRNS